MTNAAAPQITYINQLGSIDQERRVLLFLVRLVLCPETQDSGSRTQYVGRCFFLVEEAEYLFSICPALNVHINALNFLLLRLAEPLHLYQHANRLQVSDLSSLAN